MAMEPLNGLLALILRRDHPKRMIQVMCRAATNLRFAPTDSSCTVRWDASAGATDYDVSYMPASGGQWTSVPHAGDGLYNIIHDLQPNTEYRWASESGEQRWSICMGFWASFYDAEKPSGIRRGNFASPEGSSTRAPDPPTNLRITDLTKTSVRLRWDAVERATDYDVSYRRTAWRHVESSDP